MVGLGSFKSGVSSFESNDDEIKYYQLLDAFKELHEEVKKLQYSNNRHKGGEQVARKQIITAKEENELEKTNKSHVCNCMRSVPICENCPKITRKN